MDLELWLRDTSLEWLLPLRPDRHLWPSDRGMIKLAPLPAAQVPWGGSGPGKKPLLLWRTTPKANI